MQVHALTNLGGAQGWVVRKLSARYTMALLAFFGFVNVYALRVNLSIAINPMVRDGSTVIDGPEDAALVLSSFFFGYIVTQVPGGWLAAKYGAKWVFGFGILTTTVLTLVTPVAAKSSMGALICVRVIEGFGEGVTYPAINSLWARWAPPLERSKLTAASFTGAYVGTIIALPASAALAGSTFLGGWPSVFYVFGGLGVIWFVFWFWTGFSFGRF